MRRVLSSRSRSACSARLSAMTAGGAALANAAMMAPLSTLGMGGVEVVMADSFVSCGAMANVRFVKRLATAARRHRLHAHERAPRVTAEVGDVGRREAETRVMMSAGA